VSNRSSKASAKTPGFLEDLNPQQSAAVSQTEGPVLILAGAGSGKTRVLTYRIAYLLANGLADASDILAMTFTNKAAGEMRERVAKLAPDRMAGMWIGTFHSLFARLMRREGERLGYSSNFAIYDESDQLAVLKQVVTDLKLSMQEFSPKMLSYRISNAKNRLALPNDLHEQAETPLDEIVARVYQLYQNRLLELNAMDFDDLLIKPIELFERFPLVAEYYQDKFHYLLVDEYQDTNHAQYILLKILAAKHRNIAVVGDDDQSIYRWRGADIRIFWILRRIIRTARNIIWNKIIVPPARFSLLLIRSSKTTANAIPRNCGPTNRMGKMSACSRWKTIWRKRALWSTS